MVEVECFDTLPWHDSVLFSLNIDRKDPGEHDTVKVGIIWPDGKRNWITFRDCYLLDAHMNFGIIAEESVLDACVDKNDKELSVVKEKWANAGVNLDGLNCFKIRTNSTDSSIKIYALSVHSE